MCVYHNEFQQSVSVIEDVQIDSVVYHHRMSNFQLASPLYTRAEPVGRLNTEFFECFQEHG